MDLYMKNKERTQCFKQATQYMDLIELPCIIEFLVYKFYPSKKYKYSGSTRLLLSLMLRIFWH